MSLAKEFPLSDEQKLEIDKEANKRVNHGLKHPEVQTLVGDHTDEEIIQTTGCTKEYLETWKKWADPIVTTEPEFKIVTYRYPDFDGFVRQLRKEKRMELYREKYSKTL